MTALELKQMLVTVPDEAIVTLMSCSSDNLMKDDYDVENVIKYEDLIKHQTYICLF